MKEEWYSTRNTRMLERQKQERIKEAAPALLEALEECRSDLWYQIEAKHGAEKARNYPSIVKAGAAIAAARGTV